MKKGIILNFKKIRLIDNLFINKYYILLCAVFILGIIVGTIVFDNGNFLTQNTKDFFECFIKDHSELKLVTRFFTCVSKYILILVLYFVSGASLLGVAITPFITFWQGTFVGSISSYMYSTYKLVGIAYNAIVFVPPLAIFTVCCFFAARYAIDFSLGIAKLTLPRSRPISLYSVFKNYCVKYLIFFICATVCTSIEIILNILFLKFFNF